jgi:hypothetical protein
VQKDAAIMVVDDKYAYWIPELDAAAVFSLSFPPTALATDLSNEDSGFADEDTFWWDPETTAPLAASAWVFATAWTVLLEGAGLLLIFRATSTVHEMPLDWWMKKIRLLRTIRMRLRRSDTVAQ